MKNEKFRDGVELVVHAFGLLLILSVVCLLLWVAFKDVAGEAREGVLNAAAKASVSFEERKDRVR